MKKIKKLLAMMMAVVSVIGCCMFTVSASTIIGSDDISNAKSIKVNKTYSWISLQYPDRNTDTDYKINLEKGDWNYFKFTADYSTTYTFSVKNNSTLSINVKLLDSDNDFIKMSIDQNAKDATSYYKITKNSTGKLSVKLKKGKTYYWVMGSDKAEATGTVRISCSSQDTPELSKSKSTLSVGDTLTLSLANAPDEVQWVSGKKSVATVSSKGKVTAKKKGTAYIYAICDNVVYTCVIKVK